MSKSSFCDLVKKSLARTTIRGGGLSKVLLQKLILGEGQGIFAQKSNVTNEFGIEWLRRHLGDEYRIHVLEFDDPHPMHIDATLVPLAPGKLLINPERVPEVPKIFKHWDVFHAPSRAISELLAAVAVIGAGQWGQGHLLLKCGQEGAYRL